MGETPSTCIDVVRGGRFDVDLKNRTSTESFAAEVNSNVRQVWRFSPSLLIGRLTFSIDKNSSWPKMWRVRGHLIETPSNSREDFDYELH
jgi:hypothetical protein